MIPLLERLKDEVLVSDGATGTMLANSGLKYSVSEECNVLHKDLVQHVSRSYKEAGASIITTNTFGGTSIALAEKAPNLKQNELLSRASDIAYCVAAGVCYVAADIGPTTKLMSPLGDLSFEDAVKSFYEQLALMDPRFDLVLIETMGQVHEAKAAVIAAKSFGKPVACLMTFDHNGKTLYGTDAVNAAIVLEAAGADIIGANCGNGPEEMLPIVDDLVKYSNAYLWVQPNAGKPEIVDGVAKYQMTPDKFAGYAERFVNLGVNIVGGCCGTTPEHIAKVSEAVKNMKPVRRYSRKSVMFSSGTKAVSAERPVIVGEGINTTGKEKLKKSLKDKDYAYIGELADSQIRHGAQMLDVNVFVPELNEKQTMREVVSFLSANYDVPLMIDSKDPEALEEALKAYPGKALINSVDMTNMNSCGEDKNFKRVVLLARKYGAAVIGLTMNNKGIPKTAEGRYEIAEHIVSSAVSYGIRSKDVIIDCLALSAATNQDSLLEALEAIKLVKNRLRVGTCLGVSNVSHGLPGESRSSMNASYLSLALASGLDMAIINPNDKIVLDAFYAANALVNNDEGCKRLIERFCCEKNSDSDDRLYNAVFNGSMNGIEGLIKKELESQSPEYFLNKRLLPAIKSIGELFAEKRIYLPRFLRSAEVVENVMNIIAPYLESCGCRKKGKVVLATVQGDVHNIGKKIVGITFRNSGYEVDDLGVDVSPEAIAKRAIELDADAVGLSALLATAAKSLESTVELLNRDCPKAKIIIGGAAISDEYAKRLGVAYGRDAVDAVNKLEDLLK